MAAKQQDGDQDRDIGLDSGAGGLQDLALPEELAIEEVERRELLVNPSDLQDVGDPEAGDVGVAGGLAAGGEMGEGGYGHIGDDPWGLELMDGGEIGEDEGKKLAFEEEKL